MVVQSGHMGEGSAPNNPVGSPNIPAISTESTGVCLLRKAASRGLLWFPHQTINLNILALPLVQSSPGPLDLSLLPRLGKGDPLAPSYDPHSLAPSLIGAPGNRVLREVVPCSHEERNNKPGRGSPAAALEPLDGCEHGLRESRVQDQGRGWTI